MRGRQKTDCGYAPAQGRQNALLALCARLVIALGAKERGRFELVCGDFSAQTAEAYDAATTYHYGRRLLLEPRDEMLF